MVVESVRRRHRRYGYRIDGADCPQPSKNLVAATLLTTCRLRSRSKCNPAMSDTVVPMVRRPPAVIVNNVHVDQVGHQLGKIAFRENPDNG
jgi:hypothetical protein